MNEDILTKLKTEYNISYIDDVLLKKDFFSFYINLNEAKMQFYMIAGSANIIGLKEQPNFAINEILNQIQADNTFAEVDGKNSYIQNLIYQIQTFKGVLYSHIPFKSGQKQQPIWLYIKFDKDLKHNLVFGQVIRIYNETPEEITYFQKTHQDPLTKLFTRETLKDHIKRNTHRSNTYGMYLDIDGFKSINDKYGHECGDKFLIDLSNYFISRWEHNVLYYRLGGDEFFIYLYDHTNDEVIERAKKLIHDISNLNALTKELKVSVSIGIVEICEALSDYNEILDLGDKAMYRAKKKRPGSFEFHQK